MNKAVFLDKDGTLINNIPFNIDFRFVKFYPDVLYCLRVFQEQDYKLFLVTNQSGIALGRFREKDFFKYRKNFLIHLEKNGIYLTDFVYCPHHPDGAIARYSRQCKCRKPHSGMIDDLIKTYKINRETSWMIGDILDDAEAGIRANLNTIMVDNGTENEWYVNDLRRPEFIVNNFVEATKVIVDVEMQKLTDELDIITTERFNN